MSLACTTLVGLVVGFNRRQLQELLGGWNFAVSFRKELSCCLDIAYVASRVMASKKRRKPSGGPMHELLSETCLSPLVRKRFESMT